MGVRNEGPVLFLVQNLGMEKIYLEGKRTKV